MSYGRESVSPLRPHSAAPLSPTGGGGGDYRRTRASSARPGLPSQRAGLRAEASAPRRVDRVAHEPLFVGVW